MLENEFSLLKILLGLMRQLLTLTLDGSKIKIHEQSLANACYDVGEFAKNFCDVIHDLLRAKIIKISKFSRL